MYCLYNLGQFTLLPEIRLYFSTAGGRRTLALWVLRRRETSEDENAASRRPLSKDGFNGSLVDFITAHCFALVNIFKSHKDL